MERVGVFARDARAYPYFADYQSNQACEAVLFIFKVLSSFSAYQL